MELIMANVTDKQRKAFWAYVKQPGVGMNRARKLMGEVTKGITSLRDPAMTPGKMNAVLEVFAHYFKKAVVRQGKNEIALRTKEQKQEIMQLKASLGWPDEKYHQLCRLCLGRHEPLSLDEAARVIQEMKNNLKVKR